MDKTTNNNNNKEQKHGQTTVSDTSAESQSSQLLDFVIGRAGPLGAWNHATQKGMLRPPGKDKGNEIVSDGDRLQVIGDPVDASFSSNSAQVSFGSGVQYNLHGLAPSQDQPQPTEDASGQSGSEDSQKENTPTHIEQSAGSRFQIETVTNKGSSSRGSSATSVGPLSEFPLPQQTKTVSFKVKATAPQSIDLPKTSENPPPMRLRRRRSPSPLSQDSFAGPTALDDPDIFVATSRQFERPLEELGLPRPREMPKSTSKESLHTKEQLSGDDVHEEHPPLRAVSQVTPYSLSSSTTGGRVLVVDSDESNDPSQDSGFGGQLGINQPPRLYDSSLSQQTTQILNDGDASANESGASSTQGTQIIEETIHAEHGSTDPSIFPSHDSYHPTDGGSIAISIVSEPHSILNIIPPAKRHRYLRKDANYTPRSILGTTMSSSSGLSHNATAGISGSSAQIPNLQPTSDILSHSLATENAVAPSSELQVLVELDSINKRKDKGKGKDKCDEVIPASEPDPLSPLPDNDSRHLSELPIEPRSNEDTEGRGGQKSTKIDVVLIPSSKDDSALHASALKEKQALVSTSDAKPQKPTRKDAVVIPSSVPTQDAPQRGGSRGLAKTRVRGSTRSTAGKPALGYRQRSANIANAPPLTPVRACTPDYISSPAIPLALTLRMEEEETEIADDEQFSDIEEDLGDEEHEQEIINVRLDQRKRKRDDASPTLQTRSGKTSKNKRAGSTGLPLSKRARKELSTKQATRVFALWKQDSCYYTGVVYSILGSRYLIKFDDGAEDTLNLSQLRKCVLKVGDIIIPDGEMAKARVTDVSHWESDHAVSMDIMDGDDEGLKVEVEAQNVRVAARTVQAHWKDRMLDSSSITPIVRLLKDTPSPSKQSILSTASNKIKQRKLAKHGFVITFGPGKNSWVREKDSLVRTIKENGGTVLGDWSDIFTLQGKHTNANKRWIICAEDVRFTQRDGIDRAFLLADMQNQKPKFLVALALGIPCVSTEWLEVMTRSDLDEYKYGWEMFLLPAGFSDTLGARVSQMVDLDWGSSLDHLQGIMANRVPQKILKGASVLCLGADLLPLPAKKTTSDADKVLEASRTVPRIVVCMGATRVEAVADIKHASNRDPTHYDYVVVKELPDKPLRDVAYVDVTWIKECLIAGRPLPLPGK